MDNDSSPRISHRPPFVITVGRQFGSGGRELGKALADALGIAYYDKELLVESAKLAGVNPEFFQKKDERFPTFLQGLFSFSMGVTPMCYYTGASSISDDGLYKSISDFLRSVAQEKSFVVVGRSSDYILRDHPRCVNIFVHAPMADCVRRIMGRNDALAAAKKAIAKDNSADADYLRAVIAVKEGDLNTADAQLKSAVSKNPALADKAAKDINLKALRK